MVRLRRKCRYRVGLAAVTLMTFGGLSARGVSAGTPACDGLPLPSVAQGTPLGAPLGEARTLRLITADDLVQLRDIGPVANTDITAQILTVSPDKRFVAFQVRRANVATNDYCLAMYVLDLQGEGTPRQVDIGGAFFHAIYAQLGFAALTPPGPMPTITPVWSPDSQAIAYLRRDDGITQVWRASIDGSVAKPVTHLDYDAEAFAWSDDGSALIVAGHPELKAAKQAIETEGDTGFLFDDRFTPVASNRPQPRGPMPQVAVVIDVKTGHVRSATDAEAARLSPVVPPKTIPGVLGYYPGPGEAVAWTTATDPGNLMSPRTLHVRWSDTGEVDCAGDPCRPIAKLWWAAEGRTLWFLRASGRTETTDLYRWDAGASAPRRLLSTTDVLIGCDLAASDLICGYETARHPRTLVRIDLKTGALTPLYDPNPEFALFRLGTVTRLHWTNAFGIPTWGDLVLPPDQQPGQKHPLVVVQYESRGFLRGGTGDDFPIQLMAANGLAVLSWQRPPSISSLGRVASYEELNRLDQAGWRDRRSLLSALDLGVDAAIATGAIDRQHIGLTGMSDGATTVQFALANETRYAAAAISTCCYEPSTLTSLVGPATRQWFNTIGYPRLTDAADEVWSSMSWVRNAARINTPILMQLSDHEYLTALEAHTALIEQGKPVELYIFPDEYHVKWQPRHRAAAYARSVDWFRFWLQGIEDIDPRKATQYARWRRLRN